MRNILVVYYSRTGHTRQIAEAIAAKCSANLEAIHDVSSRLGFLGYWRSGREAWREQTTEIRQVEKDPAAFDLVVIGTPVWAGRMSSPIRTYITEQRSRFKRIAVFCTLGGAGGEKTLARMAELCEQAPVAKLIVTERELKSGAFRAMADKFAAEISEVTPIGA